MFHRCSLFIICSSFNLAKPFKEFSILNIFLPNCNDKSSRSCIKRIKTPNYANLITEDSNILKSYNSP